MRQFKIFGIKWTREIQYKMQTPVNYFFMVKLEDTNKWERRIENLSWEQTNDMKGLEWSIVPREVWESIQRNQWSWWSHIGWCIYRKRSSTINHLNFSNRIYQDIHVINRVQYKKIVANLQNTDILNWLNFYWIK